MKGLKNKNEYQKRISIYKDRRQKLRDKVGFKGPGYSKKALAYTKKIANWQRSIRNIENKERLVSELAENVFEFTGIDLYHIGINRTKQAAKAKKLFYKAGVESKCTARRLCEYVGLKSEMIVFRSRILFTRSFKNKPENRALWHSFQQFIQQRKYQEAAA